MIDLAAQSGIPACGICRFGDLPALLSCRGARYLPEQAKSVLVCLFPYFTGALPRRNVARYAVGDDYHQIAGAMLELFCRQLRRRYNGHIFVPYVDNSPIPEVSAAQLAGLGVAGQNGLLIHPRWGSYLFIGSVVTTLELPPTQASTVRCHMCGACLAACPTGALHGDGGVTRSLCRSALTQKKGELTAWEAEQICRGGLVWGCDICQDSCPMNRDVAISPIKAFAQNPVPIVKWDNLSGIHPQKAYNYRPEAVLRRNLQLITDTPNIQE